MTDRDLPDLIHFTDEHGNGVIHRFTGRDGDVLLGEIEVRSSFVNGRVRSNVHPEDLDEWAEVLDDLDRGDNTAWREGKRAPEIWLEQDDQARLHVTVVDDQASLTAVELTLELPADWLTDHETRLHNLRTALAK